MDNSLSRDILAPQGLPVVSLADVADFTRRHLWIISLMCLVTWGIAVLYLFAAVPRFTANADLVIDSKGPPGDPASVSTVVESQIQIIKSDSIARAVMRKLDLAKDPEFLGLTGGPRSKIRSIARSLGWTKPETEATAMGNALDSFQDKLSVKRVGVTYIVELSFESIDPERAAQILNTVAETYVTHLMDAKYNFTPRDEKWIKDRLSQLSIKASAAKEALDDYYKSRKDTARFADTVDTGAVESQLTAQMPGELRELVAAAASSKSALDNFRHELRQMEVTRQQSSPVLEASLISQALPPRKASSPKGAIVLGLSSIAGVLLGIAIGVLRDLSDQGICAGAQVWNELRIPCIAVVPRVKPNGVRRRSKTFFTGLAQRLPTNWAAKSPVISMPNGRASQSTEGERFSKHALSNPTSTDPRSQNIVRMDGPIWTITDAPQSPFTESFLELKLAIDSMPRSGKRMQVIGITSTRPNEGKSTVAAALALLMAHTGARVILLDCNLRNRSLSAGLAPTAAFGILDVMTGAVSLPAVTWTDPLSGLAFLPAGNSSRPIYASDALRSETLDELFQALRKSYKYVVVDLPAVTPFADVRATTHLLDSLILVAECGRTNIGVVERALKVCSGIHELVLGVTLNKADTNLLKGLEPGS